MSLLLKKTTCKYNLMYRMNWNSWNHSSFEWHNVNLSPILPPPSPPLSILAVRRVIIHELGKERSWNQYERWGRTTWKGVCQTPTPLPYLVFYKTCPSSLWRCNRKQTKLCTDELLRFVYVRDEELFSLGSNSRSCELRPKPPHSSTARSWKEEYDELGKKEGTCIQLNFEKISLPHIIVSCKRLACPTIKKRNVEISNLKGT